MATKTKAFDCVRMKDEIQAKLRVECERLGEDEVRRRHQEWLATSDDPLAVWWRGLESQKESSK